MERSNPRINFINVLVNITCKEEGKLKFTIMTAETLADKLVMTECTITFAQGFRNEWWYVLILGKRQIS